MLIPLCFPIQEHSQNKLRSVRQRSEAHASFFPLGVRDQKGDASYRGGLESSYRGGPESSYRGGPDSSYRGGAESAYRGGGLELGDLSPVAANDPWGSPAEANPGSNFARGKGLMASRVHFGAGRDEGLEGAGDRGKALRGIVAEQELKLLRLEEAIVGYEGDLLISDHKSRSVNEVSVAACRPGAPRTPISMWDCSQRCKKKKGCG